MQTLRDYVLSTEEIIITAHRGASSLAKENSRDAIQIALELGVKIIEVDLNILCDDTIVAYHDDNINEQKLLNLTYDELLTIDNTIVKLEDVYNLVADKAYLALELKSSANNLHIKTLDFIRDKGYLANTIFISFLPDLLKELRDCESKCHIGYIANPYDFVEPDVAYNIINYDLFLCSINELKSNFVEDTAKYNSYVGLYDVNSKLDFEKSVSCKVRFLGTDYPQDLIKLI